MTWLIHIRKVVLDVHNSSSGGVPPFQGSFWTTLVLSINIVILTPISMSLSFMALNQASLVHTANDLINKAYSILLCVELLNFEKPYND
jgi:hypothetical protein